MLYRITGPAGPGLRLLSAFDKLVSHLHVNDVPCVPSGRLISRPLCLWGSSYVNAPDA